MDTRNVLQFEVWSKDEGLEGVFNTRRALAVPRAFRPG